MEMIALSSGERWKDFFSKTAVVPPAFEREHAAPDVSTPLRITLNTIEGLIGKGDAEKQPDYQVYVSLYDAAYRQFYGKQWVGPIVAPQGGGVKRPKLKYNESLYFHTSIHSANIVAVVEVVAITQKDSIKPKRVSCGWGVLRIFNEEENSEEPSHGKNAKKVKLNYGTPRALFFMDEPVEENENLKPIPDCLLSFTVTKHRPMYGVMSLLPENTLVGGNEVIPGLLDGSNTSVDSLKRPKLLNQVPIQIHNLRIQLNPNVEKFDEELCEAVHKDREGTENKKLPGTSISVLERRLVVGVHNGLNFLEKPETMYLDVYDEKTRALKPQNSPNLRRSKRFHSSQRSLNSSDGTSTCLVMKNKVELNEVLDDPMCAVVFRLEYVLTHKISEEEKKLSQSITKGLTQTVSVRWGVWNPVLQANSHAVQVSLHGGPIKFPDYDFLFKMPDTKMQNLEANKTAGGMITLQWGRGEGLSEPLPISQMLHPGSMSSMRSEADETMLVDSPNGRKPPSGKRGVPGHQVPQQSVVQSEMVAAMYSSALQQQVQPPNLQPGYPYMPMQQPMYGYGPVYQQTPRSTLAAATEMQELPCQPFHAPIIALPPQPNRNRGLSRAAYAKLYSTDFPAILDANGDPPEVIDVQKPWEIDLNREIQDPFQCNEIVFQFLAFDRPSAGENSVTDHGNTIFFTFQFYRLPQVTTERVMLCKPQNELVSDNTSMPYIIHQLEKDHPGPAGLQIKYMMDPMFMKPGEMQMFLQHLSQQILYIDVWDGESLFLIGQCAVDLRYLCRNGHEAVQSTFELDVIKTEYEEISNIGGANSAQHPGNKTWINGKLHFRMANVGHLVDHKAKIEAPLTIKKKNHVIISQTAGNISYPGGSLEGGSVVSKSGLSSKKKVVRAHHIAEKNREVAQLLSTHNDQMIPEKDDGPQELDAETKRKLSRMEAVRQKKGIDNKFNTVLAFKTEKQERMKDYKTLEIYRLQTKKDGILNMLSQSISTEHIIHPSFGSPEFFEFVLKNPLNVQQTITIEFEDTDLRVITDAREWRYFKQLNGVQTQVEEDMFIKESSSQHPQIFLRPKETVQIPFKYLSFTTDQSVQLQGPSDPFKSSKNDTSKKSYHLMHTKYVRAVFKGENDKAVSILQLKIEPQPHVVNQTFRFYHPEQTFFKRSIRLPGSQNLSAPAGGSGSTQFFVRCSDSNVITECKPTQSGEPVDVFMKAALGASPQIKHFYVCIYSDPFLSHPVQIWQFYLHALQKVDVTCVEGQTSRFNLLLRGTQASRLVRSFSSNPREMQLHPSEQFLLAAGAVHELSVAVRPMKEGNKQFHLNVVDVECHQLVRTWLISVICQPPNISRAFELKLPVGGGKGSNKKITYTNPYPHKREYHTLSNREDLLQFREDHFTIEGGETYTIGLKFIPVMKPGVAEILVFINDEDDKNEETFKITATYK
ncbi:nephrocystin-4-like [Saccostrea cucullata]|uniref:nephrocystin-4-like n=1 Tax=Saccostrea cuccullata TaxID=36930 RepID=UPI002ECFC544